MTLNELADELLEIRRYVRSHPDHVRRRISDAYPDIMNLVHFDTSHRLRFNLWAGLKSFAINDAGRCVTVIDPEILEGYLYGAAAEIRELALREEAGR
jgi:hypothetical protein